MHLMLIRLQLEFKAKSHFQDADECGCRWAECTREAGHRTEGNMQNKSKNTPDALR